jgi:hypothetical protein
MKVLPNISLIFPNQSRVNHWRRFYRLSDQMSARVQWTTPCLYYNECKRVETALQRSIHQRISGHW